MSPPALRNRLGPLDEPQFRRLFGARTASLLGSAFAPVALAFAVLDDLDGSATELGVVLAAIWIPQIAFILVGGIFADRLPRQLVMVATDLTMFATQGTVATLLLTGTAELWHLVALQVVRGIATAFFFPAATGLVPHVVSAPLLQQANALLRLSQSSVTILGAASAGVVVATFGAGWALAFDSVTFLASAAFLVRIRVPRALTAEAPSFLRELRDGWDEFRGRTWLWVVVLGAAAGNLAAQCGVVVLGPVTADRELGGAAAWGAIVAGDAVGMLVGGLVVLRYRPERLLLVGSSALVLAFPIFAALAVPAPVAIIVGAAFLQGFGIEIFGVLWDTALQQHVPHERLSRVSAYDALGSFVFIPIGLTVAGPLTEAIGLEATIWLAGAVSLGAVLAVLMSSEVRNLRRRDPSFALEPSQLAAEARSIAVP